MLNNWDELLYEISTILFGLCCGLMGFVVTYYLLGWIGDFIIKVILRGLLT
jgi:hypothetical protein